MANLLVTSGILAQVAAFGENRRPCEAVGVIVHGTKVFELPNRSASPHDSFVLNPQDIALELENKRIFMSESDWREIVIWHTHPGGLVGPSAVDMRNRIPQLHHLVVTLTSDGAVASLY